MRHSEQRDLIWQSGLSGIERFFLFCLIFNDEAGEGFPGVERVAQMMSVDRRTVLRASKKLIDRGVLIKTGRNGYQINFENLPEREDEITPERPSIPQSLRLKIFLRDRLTCQYCGVQTANLHCDHIIPLSRGGSNDETNLTTACASCNTSKRNKTPEEWGGRQA